MIRPSPLVPLKEIECGAYGILVITYPKPYSDHLKGDYTLNPKL